MVDFYGIDIAVKPKLTKIVHAISVGDLAEMYGATRDADELFRTNFVRFLGLNNLLGREKASGYLVSCLDPLTAVRAAAVCLLTLASERRKDG